ncbi:HAD family hydrolase [Peribacillus castrilensis]|uniref:Cof-like hydrolase n=1 Tax=Peribacillus simplex TaxID=1478 RepID=A0AAN2PL18_9BACI|nr:MULTISPECIES: HAD family hydrolase [Bacillaceae]MCP1092312.1 HAD family hydrolase [Bacillaceae bacterium OS4b]MCF7624356.1 HAD family hydrolase [Peribacillus frigoritolerans]MCP1154920.1 HAD family hydrolase [Peribacillus frigoritolerans]MCT1391685.1 HAD family hydrolase [Peribacillus frigoritolerans]MEA3576023.1 HAD family hydrolase [Peribacillus frigoritolerans]
MANKAIVLDLDGTTLNERNTVNETLEQYIGELRESGKLIFIATGRTLEEVRDVLPAGMEADGMVTANGMSVFIGKEQIVEHALSTELVEELVAKAGAEEIFYEVHPNEGTRMALLKDKDYMVKQGLIPKPETVDENEWLSRQDAVEDKIRWSEQLDISSVAKIYFFSNEMDTIRKWKAELGKIKQYNAFTTASSTHHNVEVTVEGITKATGVQLLLKHFQLAPENILAVGDGENDLPLFKLAGHCVAMKNATDLVKEQADEVTEYSYREDGLYRFLKAKFH